MVGFGFHGRRRERPVDSQLHALEFHIFLLATTRLLMTSLCCFSRSWLCFLWHGLHFLYVVIGQHSTAVGSPPVRVLGVVGKAASFLPDPLSAHLGTSYCVRRSAHFSQAHLPHGLRGVEVDILWDTGPKLGVFWGLFWGYDKTPRSRQVTEERVDLGL